MKRLSLKSLSFLLLSPFWVHSQVINIESKRFLNDTNGLVGRVDLQLNINQNVQQVLQSGINVHAQYRRDKTRLLLISDLAFIKAGAQDFVNAGYQHIRYNYKIWPKVTWEAFLQGQYNRVLLLESRYAGGTGPRIRLFKLNKFRLYGAALYMYEIQKRVPETTQQFNHRASTYLSMSWNFRSAELIGTVFYQPNLITTGDYRFAGDLALEISFTSRLMFKSAFNFLYDTRQPVGVPTLTYLLRNGLSYKF